MTNKVYIGDKPFEEHIKELDIIDWLTHTQRKINSEIEKADIIPPRKQSFEIRRLKREVGLSED